MGPRLEMAFYDAFWNERKFRGLLARCQTKNRIKSISLFDLGISYLLHPVWLAGELLSKELLNRSCDRDLMGPIQPALVGHLGQRSIDRVDLED
jgi:hypothetical protein